RVAPAKGGRSVGAAAGKLERERREVGRQERRRRRRREAALRRLAPRAVADAGCGASRPAAALLGGGPRDALRLEPAHARRRVEDARANQPRGDDAPYAFR